MATDRDPLLEISTALADLVDTLERRDAQASEAIREAVQSAAAEISSPLADLLAAIEKAGPETARTISQALAGLRTTPPVVNVAAPAPTVNVLVPAPIVNVSAPEVTVQMPAAAGWRFDVDYHPNGAIKGLLAKRI